MKTEVFTMGTGGTCIQNKNNAAFEDFKHILNTK